MSHKAHDDGVESAFRQGLNLSGWLVLGGIALAVAAPNFRFHSEFPIFPGDNVGEVLMSMGAFGMLLSIGIGFLASKGKF